MRCFQFKARGAGTSSYRHSRFLRDLSSAKVEAARYSVALMHGAAAAGQAGEPWTMEVTDARNSPLFLLSFAGPRA